MIDIRALDEVYSVAWWRGFILGMILAGISFACWVAIFRGLHWVWGAM